MGDLICSPDGIGALSVGQSTLHHMLPGVIEATKSSAKQCEQLSEWIASKSTAETGPNADLPGNTSLNDWLEAVRESPLDERQKEVCRIVLALSVLRQKIWESEKVTITELADIWNLLHGALVGPASPISTVSRSAQGFLAIPLCSSLEDRNIAELWRLHVWLGDGQRGSEAFAVHAHQSFAESWILAGKATDHSYEVTPVQNYEEATHASYAIGWSDGKTKDKDAARRSEYKTHQTSSTAVNTHEWVSVTESASQEHSSDDIYQYHIPSATYHRTVVDPAAFHSTLFVFDSSRGFRKDVGALGPTDLESYTQPRDPAGRTAASLAGMVDVVRAWEKAMAEGQRYAADSRWEFSMRAFEHARSLFQDYNEMPNAARYRGIATGELGKTNRRFGRYKLAEALLRTAVKDLEGDGRPSVEEAEYHGEIGAVLRHDGRLEEAELSFAKQYRMAEQLGHGQLPVLFAEQRS